MRNRMNKVKTMPNTGSYESELLAAYAKGSLKSVATNAELLNFKAAARATAITEQEGPPKARIPSQVVVSRRTGKADA
jgi:hypothetical protein